MDIRLDVRPGTVVNGVPIPEFANRYIDKINFDTLLYAGGNVEATSGAEVWQGAIGPGPIDR
ncbi:hypothetical protein [Micromonospora sp. WMMD980]|uniref:hypothetical protein n=1 Tax=Micromonospora sp. WMMD980 TaxID=3016088 RepID=UPI0024165BCC|nr:hypothetical protein [Micromonospora sp. WMMD980]MDG4801616.1 hypothetical protein [Micromonospora sp. WMMD980]